jgi:hypothetical protein
MTVEYDNAGNVSMMTFEAKHAGDMTVSSKNSFSYSSVLPKADIDALLQDVAPDSVRGNRLNRFSFNSSCNGVYGEKYQHLSIQWAASCEGLYSVQLRWNPR